MKAGNASHAVTFSLCYSWWNSIFTHSGLNRMVSILLTEYFYKHFGFISILVNKKLFLWVQLIDTALFQAIMTWHQTSGKPLPKLMMTKFLQCHMTSLGYNEFTHWVRPDDTFILQWAVSSLVQVMACHLFGTKPLPEIMLFCYELDA